MYEVPFAEGDAAQLQRLPRHGLRLGIMTGLAIVSLYGFGIGIVTTVLHSEAWQDYIWIPISAALSGLLLGGLPASLIGGSIGWMLGRKIKQHIHAERHVIQRWGVLTSLCVLVVPSILFTLLFWSNPSNNNYDFILGYGFLLGIPGIMMTGASMWLGIHLQRWGQNPAPLAYREHIHDTRAEADFYETSGQAEQ